jgi:DNA-binding transcriptional regulator YiaG
MERSKKRQWTKEDIRALRQHLKLTQVKLAEELGTRQQTISEWENVSKRSVNGKKGCIDLAEHRLPYSA